MQQTATSPATDRLISTALVELVQALCARFGERRTAVLAANEERRSALRNGAIAPLPETAHVREGNWQIDPVPAELLERRVELIGGCGRKELIEGMNAGAKSYVADLWNMTPNDPKAILQAHKNLERAVDNKLAYVDSEGDRVRINPKSITRLLVVPRPMAVMDRTLGEGPGAVPAAFFDLVMYAQLNAAKLRLRQGGVYLYLRGVGGHLEARLWNDLFDFLEDRLALPRGTFRATVMMDNLAAVLEEEEILFELMHHSAGLSLDPQAFAADHLALFSTPDRPIFPDREHIGLNAHFLRSVSLRTISICHHRQAHAIGAPAFSLPPDAQGHLKTGYLEMMADKEREAVDGHDGTLVGHPGLVNAAMAEFNKSMPRSHQMYYQPEDPTSPADLTALPEGSLTTEGLVRCIRSVLRALVGRQLGHCLIAGGGRLHDRSSIRLATLLVWHWTRSRICFITDTGLEVHEDVVKYLIRKEGEKLFPKSDAVMHAHGQEAVAFFTRTVLSPEVPPDLLRR